MDAYKNMIFSQSSIECFKKCPLRFKMRYLDKLNWKKDLDDEQKQKLEEGRLFHIVAHRYFAGIYNHNACIGDERIKEWVQMLSKHFGFSDTKAYKPEYKVVVQYNNFILEATYDLIEVSEEQIVIWDWKTSSDADKNIYSEKYKHILASSMQTFIYLFLAGKYFKCSCEKIKMNYWQPFDKKLICQIKYNNRLEEMYGAEIENTLNTIIKYDYDNFDKSLYLENCCRCEYEWICGSRK